MIYRPHFTHIEAEPPFTPAMLPGGFGGGGNNVKEISGAAGEVIYL